jgi:hypothetical protein
VFNYSNDFPYIWDELTVPITHTSDYVLAQGILQDILAEVAGQYANHAKKSWKGVAKRYLVEEVMIDPMVWLSFNDNWIEFNLRYVVDTKARRLTRHHLFGRILQEFDKVADRIAIASTTMQIVHPGVPAVNRTAPKPAAPK